MKILHMTTGHSRHDVRVFRKECNSLAKEGHDVTLLVADGKGNAKENGVRIIDAGPRARNLLVRMVSTAWKVYRLAAGTQADICHFHDPDLIPAGWLLHLKGRQVIYDVHEDYSTSIFLKTGIPMFLRRFFSKIIGFAEPVVSKPFHIIIAEKYYAERFPKGLPVLNYPLLEDLSANNTSIPNLVDAPRLLYTGGITKERGAFVHVKLLQLNPEVHLYMIGRCSPNLAKQLHERAGKDKGRLHIVGEGKYVPFDTIRSYYAAGGWTAGLALFPPSPHYMRKEPTKIFEYMAFGIPVLASDFPTWRNLVESSGAGLVADPGNAKVLKDVLSWLMENPEGTRNIGEKGKTSVLSTYNWERESKKICQCYERLSKPT